MQINLGDNEGLKTPSGFIAELIVAGVVTLIVIFVCIYLSNYYQKKLRVSQAQLKKLESEIQKNSVLEKKLRDFKEQKAELQRKTDAINLIESQQTGPVFLFSELSDLMSEKIYLNNLEFKGNSLNIKGRSIDNIALSDFLARMNDSQYFEKVELHQVTENVEDGVELMDYSVSAVVRLPRYE